MFVSQLTSCVRRGRLLMVAAALVVPAVLASESRADTIAFSPSTKTVAPNGSFSVDVLLTTTHPFSGFSLYLNESTANTFNVTAESLPAGSPFAPADSNLTGSSPWSVPTSGSTFDFGYTSGTNFAAANNLAVATLTFQALPAALLNQTYTIT